MRARITIRKECDADIDAIRSVHECAFPTNAEARLVDQLRADGQLTISMVAVLDGEVVGHIALSPITIDGEEVGLGLAPISVVPEQQRVGIGSELVRRSLAVCRATSVPMVVVLGEPAYYSRFGFDSAGVHGLCDTYGGGEAFQAILIAVDQPPRRGLVKYATAFALFD